MELLKRYNHAAVEGKIYSFWEENALFNADINWGLVVWRRNTTCRTISTGVAG